MIRFPETPRWLIRNGRISEAQKALAFLRNTSYEKCEDECKEIQKTIGLFCSIFYQKLKFLKKTTIVDNCNSENLLSVRSSFPLQSMNCL